MIPDVTTQPAARIRFADLERFSRLFQTYCENYPDLAEFFSGDFRDSSDLSRAAERAATHSRDRKTLVAALHRQNAEWGAKEQTSRNIDRLLDPESVAVVTGQQVGLLTGPLYTVLKTITAIQVARELEASTGRPCIPVFWLEGEDHDVAEATSVSIPTDDGPVGHTYTPPGAGDGLNAGPVGRLRLDARFAEFAREVGEALPDTEFREGILKAIADSYEEGKTLVCGFARFLRTLFPDEGLVFLSPDDADLKALVAPLFRRELEDYEGSFASIGDATERIARNYSTQINPKPGNLFFLSDQGRVRLEPENGAYHLRGLDVTHSVDDVLEKLAEDATRFSANVALRPLAQDTLLPTAVYVAGPGEVAYFAQLKGLYEWAGMPMPIIYPRVSATFVEKRIRRVLDKYDVDVTRLSGDVNQVVRDVVLANVEVDVDAAFADAEREIGDAMERLRPLVEKIDASLGKTVEATRAGLVKQIEGLKGRTIRSARRQQDQIAEAIQRASNHLFPAGNLQERMASPLYLMAKYGPDLPLRWISELSSETTEHQVVEIGAYGS